MGNKVLIWHQKHGDTCVFARDPEEEERAYLLIFNMMDDIGYYEFDLDGLQEEWHAKAKEGDAIAAKTLVSFRSDRGFEYETVEVIYPTVP